MEDLAKSFHTVVQDEMKKILIQHLQYKEDKNTRLQKDFTLKYPFLRRKSHLPFLREILLWPVIKEKFPFETHIKPLLSNKLLPKITGIYKHGQTEKTGLCNLRILSNIKLNKFSIAIAKNMLDAKKQWEERLIKALKKEYPGKSIKDIILVVSSVKNDLGGNATHCKTIDAAISNFIRGDFKILFICSNNKRFEDVLQLLHAYDGLAESKQLPIDIQHDEAHNIEEGIPSKREYADNIIINPHVESYVPVTASYEPLIDEKEPLWKRENLDMYAIDYTKCSNTMSTSKDYSSISDAEKVSFEKIKAGPNFTDYKITAFDKDIFEKADASAGRKYPESMSKEDIEADKERRRQLEFCIFMDKERDALNLGMNLLDNTYRHEYTRDGTTITSPIILEGVKNLHIITTPNRVALTMTLLEYAAKKSYKPVCIGLYRGGIHIQYEDSLGEIIYKKYSDLPDDCNSEEVNNKINDIFVYLLSKGESLKRPVIIMGNYKPTGESITFVHYKYGTLRSGTVLPSPGMTREKAYQAYLRICFMDTKFVEHDKDFVHPIKFMIGYQKQIDDAVNYELQNDQRILGLQDPIPPVPPIPSVDQSDTNLGISIPISIAIEDMSDDVIQTLWEHLAKKQRTSQDKQDILNLLDVSVKLGLATLDDPTGKFDFASYTLLHVRTWKKHTQEEIADRNAELGGDCEPFESTYRFREYHSKHTIKEPYINNKAAMQAKTCEILVAYHKYEYKGFTNHKSRIWLSYKYL